MSNQHKPDLDALARKIKNLSGILHELSTEKDFEELIKIMKRPGWTTPAEFIFADGIVESMHGAATALTVLKQNLLKGSNAVGVPQNIAHQ